MGRLLRLARRLGQKFVSVIETGVRHFLVEFIEWSKALGHEPNVLFASITSRMEDQSSTAL